MTAGLILYGLGIVAITSVCRVCEGARVRPRLWLAALIWPALAVAVIPYILVVETAIWMQSGRPLPPLHGDAE